MHYTREQHKRFLDKELTAVSEEYLKKLNSKATALLSNNEIYVTQFVKLDLKNNPEAIVLYNKLFGGNFLDEVKNVYSKSRKYKQSHIILKLRKMCNLLHNLLRKVCRKVRK